MATTFVRGTQIPRFFYRCNVSMLLRRAVFVGLVAAMLPMHAFGEDLPPPDKTAGVDLRDPAAIAKGMEMINTTCGGYCHGPGGRGFKAPSLRNRTDLSPNALHLVISHGRKRAGKLMPAWKGMLTDEQIWSVIAAIVDLRNAPVDDAGSSGGSSH